MHDVNRIHDNVNPAKAWRIIIISSLFFFYEFIQMNMFNTISSSLLQVFNIDATQLGSLSAYYFIANVVFLFPAGIMLDRCSTRKIILGFMMLCIASTLCFSFTMNFDLAKLLRFLTGIGSAFCFLSIMRLASRWFPPRRLALVTGVIVTMAMAGGMASQTPLALLLQHVTWRQALQMDAALGVLILIAIYFVVADYPKSNAQAHAAEQKRIAELGFWQSIAMAFLRVQNWLGGIYTSLMNLPVALLGGLWGILYLVHTHHMSKVDASEITSMLFIGTVVGSPLVGWISDRLGRRRLPMLVSALLSLLLIGIVLLLPNLSRDMLIILFFAIGLITSAQIIGYPLVAESSPRVITSMSVSVVNISVMSGYVIFQPIFGYLMDLHVQSRLHHLSNHYVAADFSWAMWIFPIAFVLAILAALAVKETYCRAPHQSGEGDDQTDDHAVITRH